MHQIVPSAQRATAVSFEPLVGSGARFVGHNGLGQLAERRSFGPGCVASGITSLLVWPLVWQRRQRDDSADPSPAAAAGNMPCGFWLAQVSLR